MIVCIWYSSITYIYYIHQSFREILKHPLQDLKFEINNVLEWYISEHIKNKKLKTYTRFLIFTSREALITCPSFNHVIRGVGTPRPLHKIWTRAPATSVRSSDGTILPLAERAETKKRSFQNNVNLHRLQNWRILVS